MAFFKLLERKRKRMGAARGGRKGERNKAGRGKEQQDSNLIYLKWGRNAGSPCCYQPSWDFIE